MIHGAPTGEHVLFEVPLTPGETLALVKTDDDLVIRHGQQLVAGCYWRTFELGKAVEEFHDLTRRLESALAGDRLSPALSAPPGPHISSAPPRCAGPASP